MKHKAAFRIMRTYLIFVAIIMLLMVFIYSEYYNILSERENQTYSAQIENELNDIERQISSLISFSLVTSGDQRYRELFIRPKGTNIEVTDYIMLNQVRDDFRTLMGTLPLVSDAGIYFDDFTMLTKMRSIVNYPLSFYENFFVYGGKSADEWFSTLKLHINGAVLPQETITSTDYGTYEGLMFVIAWPPDKLNSYSGIMYATIKTSDFISHLLPSELHDDAFVEVRTPTGDLLLSHNEKENFDGYELNFETTNFNVSVGVPRQIVSSHLQPIRIMVISICVALILLFILLSFVFTHTESKPIRNLVSMTSGVKNLDGHYDNKKNEYEYIAAAVTGLDRVAGTYAATISQQTDVIRSHIFLKALVDGIHNTKQYNDFMQFFPSLSKSYMLALISCHTSDLESDRLAEVLSSIQSMSAGAFDNLEYLQLHEESSFVLFLTYDGKSDEHSYNELTALHAALNEKFDLDFTMFLSNPHNDIKELSTAYSELTSLRLSYDNGALNNSMGVVHSYSTVPASAFSLALDFSSMQQLYNVVRVGDFETAKSLLDFANSSIGYSGYLDEPFIRQTFYNIRSIFLRVKLENSEKLFDITIPMYDKKLSIQDLFEPLYHCCESICERISQMRETSKNQFNETVVQFIHDNIQNPDLYVKMAAMNFGISETTLQKIVQAVTGKTFFEYVEEKRMELAMELLKTTDTPINNITVQCGFSSPNSFYKAFKRRYGTAPGSVRK